MGIHGAGRRASISLQYLLAALCDDFTESVVLSDGHMQLRVVRLENEEVR